MWTGAERPKICEKSTLSVKTSAFNEIEGKSFNIRAIYTIIQEKGTVKRVKKVFRQKGC